MTKTFPGEFSRHVGKWKRNMIADITTRPVTRVSTMGAGPAPWGPQESSPSLGVPVTGLYGLLTAR